MGNCFNRKVKDEEQTLIINDIKYIDQEIKSPSSIKYKQEDVIYEYSSSNSSKKTYDVNNFI